MLATITPVPPRPRWLGGREDPTPEDKAAYRAVPDDRSPFLQCETVCRATVRGGPRHGERLPAGAACFLDYCSLWADDPSSPAYALNCWQWRNRRYGTNLAFDSPDRPWDAEVRLTPGGESVKLLFFDEPAPDGSIDPFWMVLRVVATDDPRLAYLPPDAVIPGYGRWGIEP